MRVRRNVATTTKKITLVLVCAWFVNCKKACEHVCVQVRMLYTNVCVCFLKLLSEFNTKHTLRQSLRLVYVSVSSYVAVVVF